MTTSGDGVPVVDRRAGAHPRQCDPQRLPLAWLIATPDGQRSSRHCEAARGGGSVEIHIVERDTSSGRASLLTSTRWSLPDKPSKSFTSYWFILS